MLMIAWTLRLLQRQVLLPRAPGYEMALHPLDGQLWRLLMLGDLGMLASLTGKMLLQNCNSLAFFPRTIPPEMKYSCLMRGDTGVERLDVLNPVLLAIS